MFIVLPILVALIGVLPLDAFATAVVPPTDFKSLVKLFTGIIETLIVLIFAFTFLVFMWGVIKSWIIQGGSEEGADSGKKFVFAGIVAFVVMTSLWGIVYILQSSLVGG